MKPNQSIHYYGTKTNTSITNLYNTIKTINEKLEFYKIGIMNTNRTFRIQAENDVHLLLFFTMLFLETEVQEQYKCQEIIKVIDNRFKKVFHDQYESIALRSFYTAYYYVNLLYLKNNKRIFTNHDIKENIIMEKDQDFYNQLKSFFPTLSEQAFNYIESKLDQTCKIKEKRNIEKEERIKQFLIDHLKDYTQFLDDDRINKMIEILFIIVNGFIIPDVRIPHFLNRYELFSARIQARSPESHQHLMEMFEKLGQEFNLHLEYSLHYLIYWTTLTFHDIHYVRNKRILIVSDHNQIHADYLKNHMQMQLGSYEYESHYLENCYDWEKTIDEDKYFRIISTNKLRGISKEKLIVIGDYIALDDLAEIFHHIGKENQDLNFDQTKDIVGFL